MHAVQTWPLLLGLALASCAEPLEAPSAYEQQVYLCGEDGSEARELETARCRSATDCSGWVSFRGTLQDQDVTVGAALRSVALDIGSNPEAGRVRESIELNADSPYFNLRLQFSDLPALRETSEQMELPISVAGAGGDINASLRMRGGGASVELPCREGVLHTSWTPHEHVGEARLDFGAGNVIDACFFARTSIGVR